MATWIELLGLGSILSALLAWVLDRWSERNRRKQEDEANRQALFREERRRIYTRFIQASYEVLPMYYRQPWLARKLSWIAQRMQSTERIAALSTAFFELNVSAIDPDVRRAASRIMDVIEKWGDNYPKTETAMAEFEEESRAASQAFLDVVRKELGVELESPEG